MAEKTPAQELAALRAQFASHEQAAGEVIRHWQQRAQRAEADNQWLEDALREAERRAETILGSREAPTGLNGGREAPAGHSGDVEGRNWREAFHQAAMTVEGLQTALRKEQERAAALREQLDQLASRTAEPARASPKPKPGEGEPLFKNPPRGVPLPPRGASARDKLDRLVGLASVKAEVKALTAIAEVRAARQRHHLPVPDISLHLVFTGNPGTGKTTVARIIAEMYHQIGLLKGSHVVEVTRADLVGSYIGQTAPKTRAVIDKALDGVLFIDEAYSLRAETGSTDYGKEAIEELLRALEDHRDRLVVILAGYADEMQELLTKGNPGLRSRFQTAIDFPDYAADELMAIFQRFCEAQAYQLDADAARKAATALKRIHGRRDGRFGNGRTVRNYFEACLRQQALRLTATPRASQSRDALTRLTAADIAEPGKV